MTPTLEQVLKERVTALVGEDLAAVEAEIRRELDSPVALIRDMGAYLAGAGGKRLRPMLLLLAARLSGYRGPRGVRLACVVELLHTATLIHDDVVDQAPLRRGRPSANAQWGDDASVLVGDHRDLGFRIVPGRHRVEPDVGAMADRRHRLALGEDLGVRADADLQILGPCAALDEP